MENLEITVKSLETLAKMHIDRKEGYLKAHDELGSWNIDLKGIFNIMAKQSEVQKKELDILLLKKGEVMGDIDESILSQLHQTWMDIKTAFTNKDREALLSSYVFGENIIIGSYEIALENVINSNEKVTLERQLAELKTSKTTIKSLQAIEEAV